MYIARMFCSDAGCDVEVVVEAVDVMELVTMSCACGAGLEVLGLPDWVEPLQAPIPFPRRDGGPSLDLAA